MTAREIRSAVVTGPTGAIGTALCRLLLGSGVTVYAAVNPASKRLGNLPEHPALHLIRCDAAELRDLPAEIGQADAFFHFAWTHTVGGGRNDMPVQIRNIQYAVDAAQAAAAMGCKVFLGAGSQAEYGRSDAPLRPETPCFPENGYGMAKLCAGAMTRTECEKHGIAHIWMRVLSVYGPYDGENAMIPTVLRRLRAGETPQLTAGEQIWDYIYSKDAAAAFFAAAQRGKAGAVYPLGSGESRPLREYVEMLRDAAAPGQPVAFGAVPYGEKQVMHLAADISALTADTGFVPQYDFARGIADYLNS